MNQPDKQLWLLTQKKIHPGIYQQWEVSKTKTEK